MNSEINNKEIILIYGLGESGRSCLDFCYKQGWKVRAIDDNADHSKKTALKDKYLEVDFYFSDYNDQVLQGVSKFIVSPGIDFRQELITTARELGINVMRDLEWFAQLCQAPIIGVTGSNGKTTVRTMLACLFSAYYSSIKVGGNSGIPLFSLLSNEPVDYYIIECSSFQLEQCSQLNLSCACILNITPDHLDRYSDFAAYVQAKHSIYHGAQLIVYNRQDNNTVPSFNSDDRISYSFGCNSASLDNDWGIIEQQGENVVCKGRRSILFLNELPLQSKTHYLNVLAACSIADYFGVPTSILQQEMKQWHGLSHRFEIVSQEKGITWINDSKATNVGAALAAINTLVNDKRNIILIAGGQAKGVDLKDFCLAIKDKINACILLGSSAERMQHHFNDSSCCFVVSCMQEAVEKAFSVAKEGDYVLLSPACASFDKYTGYEERGNEFSCLARGLITK